MEFFEHIVLPVVAPEGIDPVVFCEMTFLVRVKITEKLFHQDLGQVEPCQGLVVIAPLFELFIVTEPFVVGHFFKGGQGGGVHSR